MDERGTKLRARSEGGEVFSRSGFNGSCCERWSSRSGVGFHGIRAIRGFGFAVRVVEGLVAQAEAYAAAWALQEAKMWSRSEVENCQEIGDERTGRENLGQERGID